MAGSALDNVMKALRWRGPYQQIQFCLMMLHMPPSAFHIMSIVFIGRAVEHTCTSILPESLSEYLNWSSIISDLGNNNSNTSQSLSQNATLLNQTVVTYVECSVDVKDASGNSLWSGKCPNGYSYTEPRDRTVVSEWDLVCEKDTLSDVSQTVLAVGMCVGAFGFASFADRFGRKPSYLMAHCLLVVVAIVTVFVPNYLSFMVLRFFTGAGQQGVETIAWVMLIEMLPTRHRALVAQVGLIFWPISLLNLGFVGFLSRALNWRYMQFLSLIFSLVLIPQWWLSDESFRWLVANKKISEAEMVIRKTAKKNKVPVTKAMDIFHKVITKDEASVPLAAIPQSTSEKIEDGRHDFITQQISKGKASEEIGLLDAIRSPYLLRTMAVTFYIWFAGSTTYYGLIMTSDILVDNLYLGYTLNVLAEIPGGIVFILVVNRFRRKLNVVVFHTIAGLSLLIAMCLTTIPGVQNLSGAGVMAIIISLVGKLAIAAGFGMMWMYTPEYFPTNIRNTCFGLAAIGARIGGMVAPFSRTLGRHLPWAPGLIFSILCLLISAMTWFLPETSGKELPQTIAEMEDLPKGRSTANGIHRPEKC